MGKGRGPCLTSCDHALITVIVLAAASIFVIGLLDGFHVLPRSRFREYDCHVKTVEPILSRCLDCEALEYDDNTSDPEPGTVEHRMPDGPDKDGAGHGHTEPEPGKREGTGTDDRGGRLSGGTHDTREPVTERAPGPERPGMSVDHDDHDDRGGHHSGGTHDTPGPYTGGREEPGKMPPTSVEGDRKPEGLGVEEPGKTPGDIYGKGDEKGDGPGPKMGGRSESPEHRGSEDGTGHRPAIDGESGDRFGYEDKGVDGKDGMGHMSPDEPPMDGKPEDWFGKEDKSVDGKDGMGHTSPDEPPMDGKPKDWIGKVEGECPLVAAVLIHIMYGEEKHAMLHGDHSSHHVKHSFADCDQDKWSDAVFPMEYEDNWEPEPQDKLQATPSDPAPDQGRPDDRMDPDLPDVPMPIRTEQHFYPENRDAEPHLPGSGPMEPAIQPGFDGIDPMKTATEPDFKGNDPTKSRMSGEMHALMTEFKALHEAGQKFPCYVHAKNPEHAFYEAPYHHNYMGRFNNLSYPVMVTFVLLLVFAIKKICDAKSVKRVKDVASKRLGEKYIVPDAVITVPVATTQSKAAEAGVPEDEKNPTILGPEVVPGGIRVGNQTVMMEGPVTTSKEAEAFGIATPRSLVSDPFPPVEPDCERVDSPPPAYGNLSPRY